LKIIAPVIFFIVLFTCLAISISFYFFVLQPKKGMIDALEKGPGGIVELTAMGEADKAYVMKIELYEKQLQDAQKELSKLKASKKSHK
jgi:hypothetical protein